VTVLTISFLAFFSIAQQRWD